MRCRFCAVVFFGRFQATDSDFLKAIFFFSFLLIIQAWLVILDGGTL